VACSWGANRGYPKSACGILAERCGPCPDCPHGVRRAVATLFARRKPLACVGSPPRCVVRFAFRRRLRWLGSLICKEAPFLPARESRASFATWGKTERKTSLSGSEAADRGRRAMADDRARQDPPRMILAPVRRLRSVVLASWRRRRISSSICRFSVSSFQSSVGWWLDFHRSRVWVLKMPLVQNGGRVVRLNFPAGFPPFVAACFGFVNWQDEIRLWLVGPFRAIPSNRSPHDDARIDNATPLFLPTSRKEIDGDFATPDSPHVALFMPRPRFRRSGKTPLAGHEGPQFPSHQSLIRCFHDSVATSRSGLPSE